MQIRNVLLAMAAAVVASTACAGSDTPAWPPTPAVIAHRGASALRPEHTLAAYAQAIAERRMAQELAAPGPRNTCPGLAPVCCPRSITTTPFTST